MKLFELYRESQKYPTKQWLKSQLRVSMGSRLNREQLSKIINFYIIGSEAKGTQKQGSDIDIAVVISPVRGKSALQFTEYFHSKYIGDSQKPHWGNRPIDFQFFYPDDPELRQYKRIELQ